MELLTQNQKMKKSSASGLFVYNFGIVALKSATGLTTCPNAGACASGCYARSGAYMFSNVKSVYEQRLAATQDSRFHLMMISSIDELLKKKRGLKKLVIRIHDAGDFYSLDYFKKWDKVMRHFLGDSRVTFYAYTKQVSFFKTEIGLDALATNFTLIFSLGGKQDHLIDLSTDRHSRVFETTKALKAAKYSDTSNDDMIALGKNFRIGLAYHGGKNFENTNWNKVLTNQSAT